MDPLFEVHMLNADGIVKARRIAELFDAFLEALSKDVPPNRHMSIVRTKLEEACFFAKKGMASDPENQNSPNSL